jgi:acetate kinase
LALVGCVTEPRPVGLAINSGSSSLKFAAFDIGLDDCPALIDAREAAAFDEIGDVLRTIDVGAPSVVGHRIVHGGPRLLRHCRINDAVVRDLAAAEPFAPLHVPAAIALLDRLSARYPEAVQVACFDTAFHAGMPDIARTLPLPRLFRDAGVHRYGFHGLSCESILHQLGDGCPTRLVIAHLGNGASVTAVRDGKSIDTSMGLTPTGGVVMGTRTGDIDPGVLLHVLRQSAGGASSLEDVVDRQSGLLGISGISSDMQALHNAGSADAELAIAIFSRAVAKAIAAMMIALGGAEAIVFTGGIGEHDAEVRSAICTDLAWAGVGSPACETIVLPSCEEQQIARHMRRLTT